MLLDSCLLTTCLMMIEILPISLLVMMPSLCTPTWWSRLGLEVPERIYNYRTICCRRVSQNAFGIQANRYACPLSVIKFQPKIATDIVLAAICCHNLMRMRYPAIQNAAMDREITLKNTTENINIFRKKPSCYDSEVGPFSIPLHKLL